MPEHETTGEFGIIERYFKPLSAGIEGAFGLTDDAGRLVPEKNHDHVLTCDALVEGVHFLPDAPVADIGYKALAVNISDLCAKGADPLAYLLAVALGENARQDTWLTAFTGGLHSAQDDYGCRLLGGDTVATPGPTVVSITAVGSLPSGSMVHRSGAGNDDLVFVTGTVGDATLGFQILNGDAVPEGIDAEGREFLVRRHLRPKARHDAIALVREFATASLDVSDGLFGDFMKLATASGLGGTLNLANIPFSDAARVWLSNDPNKTEMMITGGDDYELLMTIRSGDRDAFEAAACKHDVQVTCIGAMSGPGSAILMLDRNGNALELQHASYEHF